MFQWYQTIKNSSNKAKWFYFQYFIYALAIILSTLWAFGHLDFVRSYEMEQEKEVKTLENE